MKTGSSKLELKPSVAAAGIESVIVQGDEVEITYAGLGGGGVGATRCRAFADGVLRYNISESGGERCARGTITVPRRDRVLIGIDKFLPASPQNRSSRVASFAPSNECKKLKIGRAHV